MLCIDKILVYSAKRRCFMISTMIDNELEKEVSYEHFIKDDNATEVLMIVLSSENNTLAHNRVINKQLLFGKSILDWVLASAGDYRTKVISYHQNDNVLSLIRPHLGNEQTTIVMYDDTPLLRHASLENLVSDFVFRGQKVRKLPRGYIFDTEYIMSNDKIYISDSDNDFDEDFLCVNNANSFTIASMKLKSRILSYHISNGVIFLEPNSVYIDADVEISSGVVIYPNNNLMGACFIADGVTLLPNNTLLDCLIDKNCTLLGCNLEKIKVQQNSELKFLTKSNSITPLSSSPISNT